MTFTLTQSDWDELWEMANPDLPSTSSGEFGKIERLPLELGTGSNRNFDLAPGMSLQLCDWNCHQDWVLKIPDHEHPIQIMVVLSGIGESEIHPLFSGNRAYFSGSGTSPSYKDRYFEGQHLAAINIELEPELLESTFGHLPSSIASLLYKGEDWKTSFYPTVTPAMRSIAQQIWNAPYCGATQQMYLYAKAWELLAMQIDLLTADRENLAVLPQFRPDTIARVHYAKEILTKELEHPPTTPDLARQVGVSERTLLRGFRQLVGTTPMGYVTQQRMLLARQLLQGGDSTVAEVARMVGYGHLGHFATAFRRQFGSNPSQYLKGKA